MSGHEVPYEPDRQDELMGDAIAVGGRAFMDEVTYAATELTTSDYPWTDGQEPAGYREAWLAHAERLIAQRRATLRRAPAPSYLVDGG